MRSDNDIDKVFAVRIPVISLGVAHFHQTSQHALLYFLIDNVPIKLINWLIAWIGRSLHVTMTIIIYLICYYQ